MADRKVFNDVSRYYDDLVNKYGHDPKACDYGTSKSQQIKFQVIADACDFTNSSVLDVGCGFGDFGPFLASMYRGVDYRGIDLSSSMIENAKGIHPDLDLRQGNFFEMPLEENSYDYVTANGIFYLLGDDAFSYIDQFIHRAFVVARKGVIFNTLSNKAPQQEENEYYADPNQVLDLCFAVSPRVALRHDYHNRDFTCLIFKNN